MLLHLFLQLFLLLQVVFSLLICLALLFIVLFLDLRYNADCESLLRLLLLASFLRHSCLVCRRRLGFLLLLFYLLIQFHS